MTLPPSFWDGARRVLAAPASARFVALLRVAGLNPAVDLRHGDLRGCDLGGEDLAGFDFTGADVTGANLEGADLTRALGLERAKGLAQARFNDATQWPREPWADAAGRDRYGPWASFTVTGKDGASVTQRLRWCPAGTFRTGSPEDEEGRFDDGREELSEPITFAQGFWMSETPCTQALWMAVMNGKNPSQFKGPDHPVEQVSLRDARRFIQRLNRLRPGLELSLPSEARWEYACRAGTSEATYVGAAVIGGKDNAVVLDRIAWYDGNSKGATHPVGRKEPNPWGLRYMLGNVLEWCADAWHASHVDAPLDGAARDGGGTVLRAICGGSWSGGARFARAAYCCPLDPAFHASDLGFRCDRVQERKATSDKPRVASQGKRRVAERPSGRGRPRAAAAQQGST